MKLIRMLAGCVRGRGAALIDGRGSRSSDTIKVGVLHSLSGTMAISETTLKDTVLMLIDEQNKKGGLLGKKLEAVVVDPASDWPLFAEKARAAAREGQGRRGVRLLDVGVAQVGAAGVREGQRPAVLPGAVPRVKSRRRTSSTPAPRRTSRRFPPSTT